MSEQAQNKNGEYVVLSPLKKVRSNGMLDFFLDVFLARITDFEESHDFDLLECIEFRDLVMTKIRESNE